MQKKGIDDDYHKENDWFLPLQVWWGHLLWWVGLPTFHCTHLLLSCEEGNVIVLKPLRAMKSEYVMPYYGLFHCTHLLLSCEEGSRHCSKPLRGLEKTNI